MKPVIKDLLQTAKFPETVYHYTNANAFLGIIQNKELWASHIRFQNDKEEAIYSLDILKEVLDSKKDVFIKHGLNIDKIFEFISSFTGLATFTISFSSKEDDLNQWRGYANMTPSYCIGFSTALLKQIRIKNEKKENAEIENITETIFAKCIYKREGQRKMIETLLDYVIKTELPSNQYIEEGVAGMIMSDFLPMSAFFKNPSFEEEDEYRLIFSPVQKDKVNIRIGINGFIPYIKVPFEEDCLRDITIAPCTDEKYILDSTSYVCVYNGIDFLRSTGRYLKNSKVPYRQ